MSALTHCQSNHNLSKNNSELSVLLEKYYDERMQLFPLEATVSGDNRFNNLLPVDFTDGYRNKLKDFFNNFVFIYLNNVIIFINGFKKEY